MICIRQRDRSANYDLHQFNFRTVEDNVVEVLTEEQHKSRLSTYTDYVGNFMRVKLVRKDIPFLTEYTFYLLT